MLRQALLGSSHGGGDAAGSKHGTDNTNASRFHDHSMNSFPGFRVLDRTTLPHEDRGNISNGAQIECDENWDIVQNSYTSTKGHEVHFLTREAKEQQTTNQQSTVQSRMEALLSHRNYGVDNTGNVRVWDAEGTMAGFCLSVVLDGDDEHESEGNEQAIKLSDLRKNLRSILTTDSANDAEGINPTCNLLELGAGQAGLAGLAMAAASVALENHAVREQIMTQMKPLHAVLTDGHPKCVDNNETISKMMPKREEATKNQLAARLLLWDSSSNGAEACRQINKLIRDAKMIHSDNGISSNTNHQSESLNTDTTPDDGLYQLCLASDCVHFQEFHDGLLTTIARTLVVNGIALLCQPKRGSSLRNFMALIDTINGNNIESSEATNHCKVAEKAPLFQVTLFEDFDAKVSKMHSKLFLEANNADRSENNAENLPNSSRYDPNRHQPLLLALRKLRPYAEEVDGEIARHHVKVRVQ